MPWKRLFYQRERVISPLTALEITLSNEVRLSGLKGKSLLLAVSGGVDSMAGLHAFSRIAGLWDIRLNVAHVHHGEGESPEQTAYRDQAQTLVSTVSDEYGLPFFSERHLGKPLVSENEARTFRHLVLRTLLRESDAQAIVFFHHGDDLLETRMLRLIRGVGPEGIASMERYRDGYFRPFLSSTREEIASYAKDREVPSLEDPTNASTRYLRNWVRREWLPQLEEKSPGARASLARSFKSLSQVTRDPSWTKRYFSGTYLDRPALEELDLNGKRQVLASFLKTSGVNGYGRSHIDELIKRLDTTRNSFEFDMLKRRWAVDASRVSLCSKGASSLN